MKLYLPILLTVLASCTDKGAGDDSAADSDTGCTGEDCGEDTDSGGGSATGTAELTFTLHFDARQEGEWQATGCIQGSQEDSIGCEDEDLEDLVVMLCDVADTTCESPVLIRAATADENEEGTIAQDSYGTDVHLMELPAGDFLVMLMIDSAGSRQNGHAWTDDFGNTETAWGGVASASDILLAAPNDEPASDYNPAPAGWPITLADGTVTAMGEDPPRSSASSDNYGPVWLSHSHQ